MCVCVCGACGWVRLRVRVRMEAGGTSRVFIGACAVEHAISIFVCRCVCVLSRVVCVCAGVIGWTV